MKAMILAAGRGERMRPLTDHTPKPLLEAGGRALIEYHLFALQQAGIRDVVINHAWLGEMIEARLGKGERYGLQIQYSAEKPQALETAGGIVQALPLLGSEPFILLNADVWCDYPLSQLPRYLDGLAHLVMVDNPPHHPEGDFVLSGGGLRAEGESRLTYSGIGVFRAELFAGLKPGRRPLAPVLRAAMRKGQISGEHYQGGWFDIGTPQRLGDLNKLLHERRQGARSW